MKVSPKNLLTKQIERENIGYNIKTHLFNDVVDKSFSLYKKDLLAHYGCVNAVEFSEDGQVFVSGSDDRRILLWRIGEVLYEKEQPKTVAMEAEHGSNVFCVSIAPERDRIVSGGNDFQVIVHDSSTRKPLDYFLHEKPVYGISIQPLNSNVFATSSEDGKVRIFDTRAASQDVLVERRSPIHSVMFNPREPQILAIASAKEGAELLDLRIPQKRLKSYPGNRGAMSARFNSTGDKLLCLRRREGPIIYDTCTERAAHLNSEGYSNACTMKSCCFAGPNDEWAVSGSDDHNVYVWRVPDDANNVDRAHVVLRGHRSVVNHVRYNDSACCLASSGVEKMVKIWSPVRFPGSTGGLDVEANENFKPRKRFTRDFSMIIAPSPNVRLSTEEDKKMLAFFDLLVERAAWVSSGDDSDDEEAEFEFEMASSASSSSSEIRSPDSDDSFQIETLSTPSSSSSSESSDSDEPLPGPSGLNFAGDQSPEEEPKLDLPAAFKRFVNQNSDSSSDEQLDSREFLGDELRARVPFKRLTKRVKRELRTRARSSSSSSS